MNNTVLKSLLIFSVFTLSSCELVFGIIDVIDGITKKEIEIKVENRTWEIVNVSTERSYKIGNKYEYNTERIIARSIKKIKVKAGVSLSAKGEKTGYYYPSKSFTNNGEVWIIDYE